jgi:hypothetical protein
MLDDEGAVGVAGPGADRVDVVGADVTRSIVLLRRSWLPWSGQACIQLGELTDAGDVGEHGPAGRTWEIQPHLPWDIHAKIQLQLKYQNSSFHEFGLESICLMMTNVS